jgi:membrane protease YdiL (CAAX protease family)
MLPSPQPLRDKKEPMSLTPTRRRRIVWAAVAFEVSLLFVAQIAGWLLGVSPLATLGIRVDMAAFGLLATLPPLALMLLLASAPWEPFQRLMRELDESLLPLFRNSTPLELALIALAAGLGEEALFRGAIQAGLGQLATPVVGLVVASVLFGLVHFITRTYALLAGLIGLYLGILFLVCDNILVPIVVHATYDFVALSFWLHSRPPLDEESTDSVAG